jgi:predicted patatin/cPLA2 family phospholipase
VLAPTYHDPITPADLREAEELAHPVLRIAAERARAGSRPRRRDDPHVLALAIEGGGMGGAVSAGMCVMLEALGLIPSFDVVYGCSSGALNGLWTAAGQAALGATNYEDAASREFISALRLLRGKPIVDLEFLFDQIATHVKPYSVARLADGPEFRAIATAVERREGIVLRDFSSPQETLAAVRASCALPLLGGELPSLRGELLADGGLVEAVPYESALRDGATHVLVLRSRTAAHRKPATNPAALAAVAHQHPALREVLRERPDRYNVAAETLSGLAEDPVLGERVLQLAVGEQNVVGRLERDRAAVVSGLQAGAHEVAGALSRQPAALLWQPLAYRVSPATPTASRPAPQIPLAARGSLRRRGSSGAVRRAPARLRGSAEAVLHAIERARPSR